MAYFSEVAEAYDQDFTFSEIGIYQRKKVWDYLRKYFNDHGAVLEVNCGTGIDALIMSRIGYNVLSTDASAEMIQIAIQNATGKINTDIFTQSKNFRPEKSGTLHFKEATFENITQVAESKKFDFVFSNFGGLNCIDKSELIKAIEDLHQLLNDSGKMALVLISPKCIWEKLYFNFKGEAQKAKRRKEKNGTDTVIANQHFKTYYFSTHEIKAITNAKLEVLECRPIALFVPPSYLEKFFSNKKPILKFLNFLDKIFNFSFLSNYADHYLIVLQKTGAK